MASVILPQQTLQQEGFRCIQVRLLVVTYTGGKQQTHTRLHFRPGYTIMQADKVPAGTYALRPMTFLPGQEGPFILRVDCSCGFKLKRVQ